MHVGLRISTSSWLDHHRPSLRASLALLVLAAVTPLVLYAALVSAAHTKLLERSAQARFMESARGTALGIERELRAFQAALETLAASELVDRGDWAGLSLRAAQIAAAHEGWIAVIGERGVILTTARPFGTPLAGDVRRELAPTVFAGTDLVVTGVFEDAAFPRPVIAVAVPVVREGTARFTLVMGVAADAVAEMAGAERADPSWVAAVFDRTGARIGSGPGEAPPELHKSIHRARPDWIRTTAADGTARYFALAPVPSAGWTVALGIPAGAAYATARQSLYPLLAVALLAVALVPVLALGLTRALLREITEQRHFLTTLAHELRTPLTSMVSWLHLVRSGRLDTVKTAHALDVIARNVNVQAALIRDLLDLTRLVRGDLRLDVADHDLSAVVAAACEAFGPDADARGIALEAAIEPGITGRFDANRIQQVVWNLVTNALKFTERGGRVTVRLVRTSGETAMLTVDDTGRGIPKEFLPRVFDRFQRFDVRPGAQAEGLGIGLAIVKHLVDAHGGNVSVDSAGAEMGTTFTVLLPLRDPPRRPA
jgi:signal transduction histidine kinase